MTFLTSTEFLAAAASLAGGIIIGAAAAIKIMHRRIWKAYIDGLNDGLGGTPVQFVKRQKLSPPVPVISSLPADFLRPNK